MKQLSSSAADVRASIPRFLFLTGSVPVKIREKDRGISPARILQRQHLLSRRGLK
jgi:hypothetical protein